MGKRLWLLVGALIVASTIVVAGATAKSSGVSSSTQKTVLVFGAEQDFNCFNLNLEACNQYWANVVAGTPVLRPAFMVTPRLQYKPELITSAKVSLRPSFSVTYNIRKNANWADGRQVTGADFLWSAQRIVDPKSQVAGRDGYDQMILGRTRITNKGKTVRFFFRQPYAAWKDLFSPAVVLPRHILQGEDYNNMLANCVCNPKGGKPFGNGPFLLSQYRKGTDATLVRNARYYGPKSKLQRIVFRFIQDTNTQIQAMRGGEVDAIFPSPQTALTALQRQSGIAYKAGPGLYHEHIDLSGKGNHNPLMERVWFRQAIIRGINRQGLIRTFFGDIAPNLRVLQSLVMYPSDANYRPHFSKYGYNPNAARQLLTRNGCRAGGDGIMVCGGVKAEITHTTTGTNRRRVLAAQIYKDNLKEIGIEVNIRLVDANVLFGDGPQSTVAGNWDMAEYAWVTSPDSSFAVSWLGCRKPSNNMTYCNRRVTQLLDRTDRTLNARQRAALFTQANQLMSNDVPVIPLYAVPVIYVHKNAAKGMGAPNPSSWGPTWNAHLWKF
jgi:peptide/nickel transport system substrate-binding protein